MYYYDPLYFIYVLPAVLLALYAQLKVKSAYSAASRVGAASGLSGAEAASHILSVSGLSRVGIEETHGHLGDHYDPRHKVLRLSHDVYYGRSLAALGIAAHEAGHALQDAKGYAPLALRNGIVPLASVGSNISVVLLALGAAMQSFNLVIAGILLFSTFVVFQLINLPVEYNASSRAKEVLLAQGLISRGELGTVEKVLSAAALTYVAATLTAIFTLLYFLARYGSVGRQRE